MNLYPLKLKPVLKDAIWGGTRLASEYGKADGGSQKIAESWELTAHKNGVNTIENGEYAGNTLEDLFKNNKSIVSPVYKSDKFPLLIKFIDAEQDLSVQVHPDDEYAQKFGNDSGKTEMWYIIDAKPGAKIVYGLNSDYTREDLQTLIDNGRFEECLNYIEVMSGDVYFIPSGLVHAIGAGILIAEIQQNSDITYRFYDYNRLGADGTPRELHINQALDVCIKIKTEYKSSVSPEEVSWFQNLADCEYFQVNKVDLSEITEFTISARSSAFYSVICISGEGEISHGEKIYKIKKGDSYFLPALNEKVVKINKISENFTFLLTTLGGSV